METPSSSRPYRSHKIPACDLCRQRKARCLFDKPGERCALCREKGLECLSSPGPYPRSRTRNGGITAPRPSSNRINHGRILGGDTTDSQRSQSSGDFLTIERAKSVPTAAESSNIVGPVVAEDIQILEQYLTSHDKTQTKRADCTQTTSIASGNPILYLSVPRRRDGLRLAKDPGSSQKDIMEQIIRPYRDELIELYFEHIHLYFPVLDELMVRGVYDQEGGSLPPALTCELFANALPLWTRSSKLRSHPRPDLSYAWSLAVNAIQEEFLAPSILTVQCALIDLIGRPMLGLVGNIVNEGRTVALALTFGLNRNPASWKCPEKEKSLRVRAWWGVLVNNRW